MKKFLLVILLIVFVLNVGVLADLVVTDVTVGGTNQERGVTTTATFTITNVGNLPIDVTSVVSSAESKYEIIFDKTLFTLAPYGTKLVTITAKVPQDFHAVDADLQPTAFEIGTVSVTGIEGTTTIMAISKLRMQASMYQAVAKSYEQKSSQAPTSFGQRMNNIGRSLSGAIRGRWHWGRRW
ncbi:hypothetical protein HZA97_02050 [Candidatus Woesearchaeota archaeon]|nr:hypothetical protein [Candidatus Woesearchaeota archaeon]